MARWSSWWMTATPAGTRRAGLQRFDHCASPNALNACAPRFALERKQALPYNRQRSFRLGENAVFCKIVCRNAAEVSVCRCDSGREMSFRVRDKIQETPPLPLLLEGQGRAGQARVRQSPRSARIRLIAQVLAPLRELLRSLVYRFYERRLARRVAAGVMPRHVGIILDGNRRYGRANGFHDPDTIYRLGAAKLDDILSWSTELKIPMLTLWVFSTDNLGRPEAEIGGILRALESKMRELAADPHIAKRGVRVAAIGRREILPAKLLAAIDAAERATRENDRMTLTLAVGYGGREEIADAVRSLLRDCAGDGLSLAEAAAQVSPHAIREHLYLSAMPDPDLIIRTSGETRLSGFMLWQSVHSELHFSDVHWPAFRRIDYLRAIRSFQRRDRRFGI
jgi:short-chain Z-isoprenyl diphosphate synthase